MTIQTPTDALSLVPFDVLDRLTEVMIDCKADGSYLLSESVANEHGEDLQAILHAYHAILAAPASPLPEGGGGILWMMHVRGPDDIYPAPDYETAVAWCDYVNDVLAKAVPEVMTKAVPAIWTGTPESHADALPEAIKGWTLPAAPTGVAK